MSQPVPSVSVVIPVFEGERYLGEAIESALRQSVPPTEVIVIDDGSSDGSAALADSFGGVVRCVRQAHAGIGAGRNRGVAEARGELIAFLDADDLWDADKTRLQLAALANDPTLDMVFGHALQFHSAELTPEERARTRVPAAAIAAMVPGGGLFRAAAFARVGPFETQWRVGEFVSWYQHAMELGLRFAVLLPVVLHRRIHTTNQGIRARDAMVDYVRIVKAAIDRRRRAALTDAAAKGEPSPD